jgi:hypothetical protein
MDGRDFEIPAGFKQWKMGRMAYGPLSEQPVACSGAWTGSDTYTFRLCFNETPTSITVKLGPDEAGLKYEAEYNVAFGPTKPPPLIGRAN